ncbi:hypothetical protein, partial [Oceanicella sp. SM1341]|uniref:hypothetical protein n=1 Tax=Oceanicella sp. SM1341 TaxID=1548889 RepID=UPI0013002449
PVTASITTFLLVNGVAEATAVIIAGVITYLAPSVLLSFASTLLVRGRPKAQDVIRELQTPNTLPPYRFVYGHTRVYGTYAPVKVKGRVLYACLILNSRPSAGPFTIFIDKREVELSGDVHDFGPGGGASATNDPFAGYLHAWIGRGDQVSPPFDVTDQFPGGFRTSDAWRGRTVLWLRLNAGPNGSRPERWPRLPPEVEVEGDWSL